ncbi:phage holin family protein [Flexivirga caeni]|uniref:Phage holin family protein n=1 Tax=Flexivirga caeni TaxID=2294115 RepID=A0A3M9MKK1_9MICO|nr:phage holin family protein [Flexivirga caeni]RNI25413.1 phage holin family protein [Flexivirga caeni]
MRNFLIKTGINAVALWIAAIVVPGITLAQDSKTTGAKVLTIIVIAAVFGVINAVVKPIANFFSFPLIILTLGLFTFVVNAFMLQILSWLSDTLGLAFHINDFFWTAILGALVVSFVSMLINLLLPDHLEQR